MKIFKHYRDNKKDGMTFIKNVKELFFHLHNGKKRVIICIVSGIINYLAYKHGITNTEWIVLLSTEYFILEIAKALTSEGLYK